MPTIINQILCGSDFKNTGVCDCFFDPKNPLGMILVPKDFKITNSDLAIIQSFLEGKTRLAKGSRIYPIQNFVSITDNSEDVTEETFAYGQKEQVREGNYSWMFGFRKGGATLNNKLRYFNGKQDSFDVIFIDAQNALYGTVVKESNGDSSLAGIPLTNLYTAPLKINDGSKNTMYSIKVEFAPVYLNEKLAFAKIDATDYLLTELKGLIDIALKQAAAPAANGVFTISVNTDCGENLYDLYNLPLGVAANWLAYNAVTGAAITVTSAVANPGLKAFTVTLNTADTDYPASVGGKVNFTLVNPVQLASENIVGFESNVLIQSRA